MQCLQCNFGTEDLLYFVVLLHKNKFTSARDPEGGNEAVQSEILHSRCISISLVFYITSSVFLNYVMDELKKFYHFTSMYFTLSMYIYIFHFLCISRLLYFTSSVFHFFCISLLLYFTDIYNGQRHCAVSCRIAASLFLPLLPPSLFNNPHMLLFNIIDITLLVIIIIIDITLLQLSLGSQPSPPSPPACLASARECVQQCMSTSLCYISLFFGCLNI